MLVIWIDSTGLLWKKDSKKFKTANFGHHKKDVIETSVRTSITLSKNYRNSHKCYFTEQERSEIPATFPHHDQF